MGKLLAYFCMAFAATHISTHADAQFAVPISCCRFEHYATHVFRQDRALRMIAITHARDKGFTMQYDIITRDTSGRKVASYGPRRLSNTGPTESCEPHEAAFWRVYSHNAEGHAVCVGDALDSTDAAHFARYVALVGVVKITLED
jgi:hypothetical protein